MNDDPKQGVEYQRNHCRYPLRNVYVGPGNDTCEFPPFFGLFVEGEWKEVVGMRGCVANVGIVPENWACIK